MGEKVKRRITKENINQIAREICKELIDAEHGVYTPVAKLAEKLNLTEHQVLRVGKYIRNKAYSVQYEEFIKFYVISSKKGYALLKKMPDEEIVKCYKTLNSWANSLNRTLYPLQEYIRINELPIDKYKDDDDDDNSSGNIMDAFELMNTDGATGGWKE